MRRRIPGHRDAHLEAIKKLAYNFALVQESDLAESLLQSGMTVGPDVFTLPMSNLDQVAEVRVQAEAAKEEAYESLQPILHDLADRIVLPLQLLGVSSLTETIPDGADLWDECQHLLGHEAELREHRRDLLGAYDARELIRSLIKQLEGRESNEKLLRCLIKATARGAEILDSVREKLRSVQYPFDHAEEAITVSKYLLETLPPPDYPGAVDGALSYAANEGLKISSRIIGRLCVIAETTETALGLPLGEAPASNNES